MGSNYESKIGVSTQGPERIVDAYTRAFSMSRRNNRYQPPDLSISKGTVDGSVMSRILIAQVLTER